MKTRDDETKIRLAAAERRYRSEHGDLTRFAEECYLIGLSDGNELATARELRRVTEQTKALLAAAGS